MPQKILDSLQTYNTLIRESSDSQSVLFKEVIRELINLTSLYKSMMPGTPEGLDFKTYNAHREKLAELKTEINQITKYFNDFKNATNYIHGEYSHIWGSYAEKTLFDASASLLQKQYGAHTFYYKTRKVYNKNKHLEIDLIVENDTHVFVVEIKAVLKPEVFTQIINILDKFKIHFPEFKNKQIVPVLACLSATNNLIEASKNAGIMVITQTNDVFNFVD
jgi:hypothetical protein